MFMFMVAICVFYAILHFIDTLFKTCMFYPYIITLNKLGLDIAPLRITWTFTRFNRAINRIGQHRARELKLWFDCGIYISIFCILPAVWIIWPYISHTSTKREAVVQDTPLVSVIPGVNAPFSDGVYVFFAILICMIVHEFGHALAASRENVSIDSCGIGVLTIIPFAFVNLTQERVNHLTLWQQLRIYCGGVWHNIMLFIAILMILVGGPILFRPSPVSNIGGGATIVHLKESSGIAQTGGLNIGDEINSINNCQIFYEKDWNECLDDIISKPQLGFCLSRNFVARAALKSVGKTNFDCCGNSTKHYCFESSDGAIKEYVCLLTRKVVISTTYCNTYTVCKKGVCLVPVHISPEQRLMKFERKSSKFIIYLGNPTEIKDTVMVTTDVSRFRLLNMDILLMLKTFLTYILGFSGGIFIMNIIPCYGLDGAFIIENIINLYFAWLFKSYFMRRIVVEVLKVVGTFILINICYLAIKNAGVYSSFMDL